MNKVFKRRSDPLMCQYYWDAITTIRNHKQLPSFDRIRRYMNRTHSMDQEKVEKYLEECTTDNLIIVSRKVGQKGSKVGVEQEGFRLPVPPDEPESHDWYCFMCHKSGEVITCSKCYRVFHESCLNAEDFVYHPNIFVCRICKKRMYERTASRCRIPRDELNRLLSHLAGKLKEKMPINILERSVAATSKATPSFSNDRSPGALTIQGVPGSSPGSLLGLSSIPAKTEMTSLTCGGPIVSLCEPWRAQLLLHHQMDSRTMEQKARDIRYKSVYDFEIDALTIVHNCVIFHGASSNITEISRQMLRECQHELSEINQCKDCYRYSRDKNEQFWFCKPCNPPHELVYAKEKGFPYWPAKVLKVENDIYHIRFFGSQHQTAEVEKDNIKPISTNIHALQLKRTSAWIKAYEELKKHQELLSSGYYEPIQPHPTAFAHPYQPPPPPPHFQQQYHPFPHQPVYPQYPPPQHPHLIHSQQHWDPRMQHSEPHHRLPILPSSMPPGHPHYQYPAVPSHALPPPLKKESESQAPQITVTKEKESNVAIPEKRQRTDEKPPIPEPPIPEPPILEPPILELITKEEETINEPKDEVPEKSSCSEEPSHSVISSTESPKNVDNKIEKAPKKEIPEDMVSSSSQDHQTQSQASQTPHKFIKILIEEMGCDVKKQKQIKEAALKSLSEKLKKENEEEKEKLLKEKQNEVDKLKEKYETKIKKEVSETKRKQWCWTCESEAMYHCCWNTAYCSVKCQQTHWHKEHKRNCRRKRSMQPNPTAL